MTKQPNINRKAELRRPTVIGSGDRFGLAPKALDLFAALVVRRWDCMWLAST